MQNVYWMILFIKSGFNSAFFFIFFLHIKNINIVEKERKKNMSKKLSKKELEKLELQMGISKVQHDRPPVGRPTVFYGKTNKQKRREGKMMTRNY